MTSYIAPKGAARLATLAAIAFIGFFILGYGGILIANSNGESPSPVWPATAFGLCIMLRLSRSRRDDIVMLGAIVLSGLLVNGAAGSPLPLNLGYSLINPLDVMTGLVAMRRLALPRFNTAKSVARFVLAAVIGPAMIGGLLAGALMWAYDGHALVPGVKCFVANLLGVCILFPFGMTVSLRQFAKLKLEDRFFEALVVFSLLGGRPPCWASGCPPIRCNS